MGLGKMIHELVTRTFGGSVYVPFDILNTDPSTMQDKPYVSGKCTGDDVAMFVATQEQYTQSLTTEAKTLSGAVNELNGFVDIEPWDDEEPYVVGNVCIHTNIIWVCSVNNTNEEPVSGSTYWTATTLQPKTDNTLATTDKTVVGAINELNTALMEYSTTEKSVGKWIDDSTIYQKTLYIASMPDGSSSETDYEFGNFKFDMIVDFSAILFTSSKDQFIPMPYIYTGSALADIQFGFAVRNNKSYIGIRSEGVDRSSQSAYITIKYTKAT